MSDITWTTEQRKLGDLVEWTKNPRRLSKHDAEHLKKSLEKFGIVDPLVINADNHLIGGHQRKHVLQAAKMLGADAVIDVRVPSRQLDEREAEELAIRLNKNAGEWDFDLLANGFEVPDLLEWGFTAEELNIEQEPEGDDPGAQVDKAEELREKWGVEAGQLWRLGEHRLICGDCTDRAVVERVMGGEKAELLFTSPPYADMREYDGGDLEVSNLARFIGIFEPFANYQVVNLGIKRENGAIVTYWNEYIHEAEEAGLILLSWNIWDRLYPASIAHQTAMFPIEHEWLFVFGRSVKKLNLTVENKLAGQTSLSTTNRQENGTLKRRGARRIASHRAIGSVTVCDINRGEANHPAVFPVELPSIYIEAMTNQGESIAEPFLGSGTTLIACERLGRKCRAIEISPAYCAVALERFYQMSGVMPELITE